MLDPGPARSSPLPAATAGYSVAAVNVRTRGAVDAFRRRRRGTLPRRGGLPVPGARAGPGSCRDTKRARIPTGGGRILKRWGEARQDTEAVGEARQDTEAVGEALQDTEAVGKALQDTEAVGEALQDTEAVGEARQDTEAVGGGTAGY